MADKELTLVNGAQGLLKIYPTFEGEKLTILQVSIDESSDLKGLVTLGELADGGDGIMNIPVTAIAEGVQEATIVFKCTKGSSNANVEGYGKSTKTVALTITAADAARLENTTSAITFNLWESHPFSFQVMKGENDILPSVTSVTVDQTTIDGKYEFTGTLEGGDFAFKAILSSSTEQVTANAKVTIAGTDNGTAFSLDAFVALTTNINDGSIPTNRFDVQFQ